MWKPSNSTLKGRHLWQQRRESSLRSSIDYFEKAIAIDPTYALAHAGIADSFSILRVYGYVSEREARYKAENAARRAMELDPTLAEAHFALGLFHLYFSEDWPTAEGPLREAVKISPRNAMFNVYLGFFLASRNRFEEAETWLSKGTELDPLSPLTHALFAASLCMARRYETAVQRGQRSLELDSDFQVGLLAMGIAYCNLEQYDSAIQTLERLVSVSPRTAWWIGELGTAYALAGRKADALALRTQLLFRGPSPTGGGWREAPGEGERRCNKMFTLIRPFAPADRSKS